MGILKWIKGAVSKVIIASTIGIATIFSPVTTQAITQPPVIEMQYEVYDGKVYDGEQIKIVVEDKEDEKKESTMGSIKRWVTHPIESTDKKINEIKKGLTDDFKTYGEETKKELEDTMSGAFATLQAKWVNLCIKTMTDMFNFLMQSIIIIPTDLVTNDSLRDLYFKFLVVSMGLTAIFAVYNCLMSMVDESNYIGLSFMMGKIFKAILFMFGSAIYFPLFITWINQLSSGILSLAMKQVEMNIFFNEMQNGALVSISGALGASILSIVMTAFLFQIFLHTCCRYWEVCKVFCIAPLAFAMSIIPSQAHIYISWKNKFKHILFLQVLYSLHLAIFVTVMSVHFDSKILSIMLFAGGIWDLSKLPTGLEDILRTNSPSSPSKATGFGKQVISSLLIKKMPGK